MRLGEEEQSVVVGLWSLAFGRWPLVVGLWSLANNGMLFYSRKFSISKRQTSAFWRGFSDED
jgi:hypothetical protein